MKSIFKIFFLCALSMGYSKDGEIAVIPEDDSKDPGLKIGDIAPSWALMSGPGKFEFLKTWTEEKGKRLKNKYNRIQSLVLFYIHIIIF